jgi:hypothetical protein
MASFAMTQEIQGASSITRMDVSHEGDIAVVTGDCIRHLNWHDKNMDLIYSPGKVSSEVDVETIAPTLQSFRASEVLCIKFSPATVSPNGRVLLAASTSLGEIFVLRSPQLGVASSWLCHVELTSTIADHLNEQPELQEILSTPEPPSQFIMAQAEAASDADALGSNAHQQNQSEALEQRMAAAQEPRREFDIHEDARRKQEIVEKLKRKLAEAEAASKYAAAMKAIDANGQGNAQASKDAEEAAASAEQAAKAVAAASLAAEEALALTKLLPCNQAAPSSSAHQAEATSDAPSSSAQPHDAPPAESGDADSSLSGNKRVRLSDGSDQPSVTGMPRTPAAYTTKTPGYISKFAMDSRVPGASDQLARIIKAMQKQFLAERAKLPSHLQTSYGSWNKFTESDQNLMNTCFERVYAAEEDCVRSFQLEDVCTTKRLQQHVRIALRKIEGGEYVGEADEVERHLFNESAQNATQSFATPSSTHPAFAAGGRTGTVSSLDTPSQSLKKQQYSTPRAGDDRAVEKMLGLGGKKHPYGQLLAMHCRSMCVPRPEI